MKKLLVTGGNGYIGGHLVKDYLSRGFEVDSIDISNSDNSAANNHYKLDISDDKNLSSIKNNYDAVIHCAGSPSVPMSLEKPLFDFSINLRATVNMLEFSRLNNSMFIFLSTVTESVRIPVPP